MKVIKHKYLKKKFSKIVPLKKLVKFIKCEETDLSRWSLGKKASTYTRDFNLIAHMPFFSLSLIHMFSIWCRNWILGRLCEPKRPPPWTFDKKSHSLFFFSLSLLPFDLWNKVTLSLSHIPHLCGFTQSEIKRNVFHVKLTKWKCQPSRLAQFYYLDFLHV